MLTALRIGCIIIFTMNLGACAIQSAAISKTVKLLATGTGDLDELKLDPKKRYLRVEANGQEALMVLGYIDHSPDGNPQDNTEVWYSAKGEVIQIRNGHIIKTAGLSTDWREVRMPPMPDWNTLTTQPYRYDRERDEMPGYRFGIRESIIVRPISVPKSRLLGRNASELIWFEETSGTESAANSISPAVTTAHFAVDLHVKPALVVYGEQCLTETLCLHWQRWPVRSESPH